MTLEDKLIDHIHEICGAVENCGCCPYHGVDGECHETEYLESILMDWAKKVILKIRGEE